MSALRAALRLRPPPGLTARIALLFAAATLAVFAATGWVLDRTLAARLAQRDVAELAGKLAHLRYLLEHAEPDDTHASLVQALLDALVGHEGLALALYDAQGTLVAHRGAPLALRPEHALPETEALPELAPLESRRVGETPWRVLTARAPVSAVAGAPRWIVLGRDTTLRAELQAEYRRQLGPALAAAALAAAALGALAVWAALRPLRRVTATAQRIQADRLHERIQEPSSAAEVRALVDAFNTMLERLDASFAQLARFSADLAHEFKTPLANLLLQSQVSLAQPRTPAQYEALLASNVEELERLSRMVDNMLFLARAENAQVALTCTPLDARAELARVAEYFELLADERGVTIEVAGSGTVVADAELLRRALGNLVANAVRHATPGSRVLLAVDDTGLTVSNHGTPIAAADLPRLFDRFYRADPARGEADGATGLGLAIVRSIMELHGGRVSVAHAAGHTTFALRFGSAREAPPPAAAPRP